MSRSLKQQLIKLQKKLSKLDVNPASLRKDMKLRKETAKEAKKLLKKIRKIQYGDEPVVKIAKVKKNKKTKRIRN